jgi:hypothetical protein
MTDYLRKLAMAEALIASIANNPYLKSSPVHRDPLSDALGDGDPSRAILVRKLWLLMVQLDIFAAYHLLRRTNACGKWAWSVVLMVKCDKRVAGPHGLFNRLYCPSCRYELVDGCRLTAGSMGHDTIRRVMQGVTHTRTPGDAANAMRLWMEYRPMAARELVNAIVCVSHSEYPELVRLLMEKVIEKVVAPSGHKKREKDTCECLQLEYPRECQICGVETDRMRLMHEGGHGTDGMHAMCLECDAKWRDACKAIGKDVTCPFCRRGGD